MSDKPFLSLNEVAERICHSPSWVRQNWPRMVTEGKIKVYRPSKKVLLRTRDVDRWVESKALFSN